LSTVDDVTKYRGISAFADSVSSPSISRHRASLEKIWRYDVQAPTIVNDLSLCYLFFFFLYEKEDKNHHWKEISKYIGDFMQGTQSNKQLVTLNWSRRKVARERSGEGGTVQRPQGIRFR